MAHLNSLSFNNDQLNNLSVDELKSLVERLTFIQHIGSEFTSTLNLNELLDKVLEEVVQVLQAEAGSIWLCDPIRREIMCYIAKGPTKAKVQNLRLKEGQGIVGSVALTKQGKLVSDVQNDPTFAKDVDKSTGFITRSMICAPITVKGESLGSIQVINKIDVNELFQENDLELLSVIASNAGVAIKNAQLYASEKKAKELSAILEISKEITATLDIQQVLFTIVNLASRVVEYDRCAIALEHKGMFELSAVSGIEELDKSNFPALHRLLTWSGNTGREVWIRDKEAFLKGKDILAEFQDYFNSEEMHAVWLVPLKDEEGTLGVLSMEGKVPNFIPDFKFQMLRILVNQVTVAIRNAQLYSSVPMGNVLDRLVKKKKGITKESKWKWSIRLSIAAAVLAILMIPLPFRVAGDAVVEPLLRASIYPRVTGTVKRIPENVREGATMQAGNVMAILDNTEYNLKKLNLTAQLHMLERSLPRLQTSKAIAEYKQNQLKLDQVKADLALVDYQLENCEIRSTVSGIILTPAVEEQVGSMVLPGKAFCELSDLSNVRIDINIPEEELGSVAVDEEIQLKVKAYPLHTYKGKVIRLAQEPQEVGGMSMYAVRAIVANRIKYENNSDLTLKPGMTGRAKIIAPSRSIGKRLFGGVIRWFRLKFWV